MAPINHKPTNSPVDFSSLNSGFAEQVAKQVGTDFNKCYHCRSCACGCPFYQAMDYAPHGVIRLIQLGLKQEALKCSTIWICVGCHTCAIQCPMAIDISAVMDAVSQIALQEKAHMAEPDIFNLHKEVLKSIERYGRAHKLEIMLRYKIQKHDWFGDLDVGIKMLAKRKLDFMPSRVKNIEKIKALFK